jgi:hypothetical protein
MTIRRGSASCRSRWAITVVAVVGLTACDAVMPTARPATPAASPSDDGPVATTLAASPSASAAFVPSEDPPLEIEVVETGFTAFPDDSRGVASYGAILRNPNTGWSLQRAEVRIDFLDATGAFITGAEVAVTILPGQTTAIAGQSSGAGDAASMTVQPPEDLTAFVPRPATDDTFEVRDLQTESMAGQWVTTGQLVSGFTNRQSFVQLVAIHRDATGAIVGGGGGGVEALEPAASAAFEIVDASPYAEVSVTEVHWQVTR